METRINEIPKIESADFTLPNELLLEIFDYFTSFELALVSIVCKNWKRLAAISQYEKSRQRQLEILEESYLWQYLPAIAKNENILEYYETHIDFKKTPGLSSLTLNELLQNFKKIYSRCELYDFGRKKLTADFLKEQADFILQNVNELNPSTVSRPHKTLEDFLKFSFEHREKQRAVFLAYLEMESILAVVRLILDIDKYTILSRSSRISINTFVAFLNYAENKFIKGDGLIFVENISLNFVTYLIDESIKLHLKILSEKSSAKERKLLKTIDRTLKKLTSTDWLDFLIAKYQNFFQSRTRLNSLLYALRVNHPIVLAQCTEKVLLKILELDNYSDTGTIILKSPIALKHLSDEALIEFVSQLVFEDFKEILSANPDFLKRISKETIADKLSDTQVIELSTLCKNSNDRAFWSKRITPSMDASTETSQTFILRILSNQSPPTLTTKQEPVSGPINVVDEITSQSIPTVPTNSPSVNSAELPRSYRR